MRGPRDHNCPSAGLLWALLGVGESTKKGNRARRGSAVLGAFRCLWEELYREFAGLGSRCTKPEAHRLQRVGACLQRELSFFKNCLLLVANSPLAACTERVAASLLWERCMCSFLALCRAAEWLNGWEWIWGQMYWKEITHPVCRHLLLPGRCSCCLSRLWLRLKFDSEAFEGHIRSDLSGWNAEVTGQLNYITFFFPPFPMLLYIEPAQQGRRTLSTL